jgi:glycosyltransferase involved in cell wall biosynthesis
VITSIKLRFSIIIPAHNEEKYIGATLEHITSLSYPTELYEVIVVENGSADRTLDIAKQFEGGNIRVYKNEKTAVSAAKNSASTGFRLGATGLYSWMRIRSSERTSS